MRHSDTHFNNNSDVGVPGAWAETELVLAAQAHPRRVARVTRQIEREMGDLLATDKILLDVTGARGPGRAGPARTGDDGGSGSAPRAPVCTCTGCEVSGDLQVVKIFLSIFTDDAAARRHMMQRCQGLSGYARLAACAT